MLCGDNPYSFESSLNQHWLPPNAVPTGEPEPGSLLLNSIPLLPLDPMRYDDSMDSNMAVGGVGANSSSDFVSVHRLYAARGFRSLYLGTKALQVWSFYLPGRELSLISSKDA